MRIFSPDPIDAEELVSPLEAPVPVRHAPGDDPGDVDGRVLLLAAHHIEAQSLLGLGQLHHAWVGVTLGSREGSHCGLGSCAGPNITLKVLENWNMGNAPDVWRSLDIHCLVHVLIHLPHSVQELRLENFLERCQFSGGHL